MSPKLIGNLLFVAILALFISDAASEPHAIIKRMNFLHKTLLTMKEPNDVQKLIRNQIQSILPSGSKVTGESMIGLLKLMTVTDYFLHKHDLYWLCSGFFLAMKFLVMHATNEELVTAMQINRDVVKEVLDWQTFLDLFRIFRKPDVEELEVEWACILTMLAIESSTHLEYSFTKEMMNSLNYSRKRANALWRLSVYKNLVNEPQIRFEYEAIIINKNLSNRRGKSLKKMLPQIKKYAVEDAVQLVIDTRELLNCNDKLSQEELNFVMQRVNAMFYYAFAELSDKEILNYPSELSYALTLHEMLPKTDIFNQLHTELYNRVKAELLNKESALSKRMKEFKTARNPKIRINRASDPKYLNYAAIALLLIIKDKNDLRKVFYEAFYEILDEKVFNNREQLLAYTKYHSEMYFVNAVEFQQRNSFTDNGIMDEHLERILKRAGPLLEMEKRSTLEKTQLQVLNRLALQISTIRFNDFETNSNKNNKTIEDIASLYMKTEISGSGLNPKDAIILREWYRFTLIYPEQVARVLNSTVIDELVTFTSDQLKKQNSEIDSLLYIFLVRNANVLVARKRKSDTKILAKKIFELEQKIGAADTIPIYIYDYIVREKERFYVSYAMDAMQFKEQVDLIELIDHHIEIMGSGQLLDDDYDAEYKIKVKYFLLKAIFEATINDPTSQELLKNDNRRLIVGQIYGSYLILIGDGPFAKFNKFPKDEIIKDLYGVRE